MRWLFGLAMSLLVGALGPSFVLRLAPPTRGGRWLGAWYGSTALGYWMAGRLGGLWDRVPHSMFFIGLALLPLFGVALCLGRWRDITAR